MDHEQALRIVVEVLDRHGIERVEPPVLGRLIEQWREDSWSPQTIAEMREPIAFWLRRASGPEPPDRAAYQAARTIRRRAELLEELLPMYATEPAKYQQLANMLKTEQEWRRLSEPMMNEPPPPSRPTSAKHAAARQIYQELAEAASLWQACQIIADMYVAAGIDDRAQEKIIRSLYDKLSREVREVM